MPVTKDASSRRDRRPRRDILRFAQPAERDGRDEPVDAPPRPSGPNIASNIGVRPTAGAIAFTRMRSGASSRPSSASARSPRPCVALYQRMPGRGRIAVTEAMLMTTPPPRLRSTGNACDRHVVEALDVDCEQPVELGLRRLRDARRLLRDRGVVHDDVEAAGLRTRLRSPWPGRRRRRDVAGDAEAAPGRSSCSRPPPPRRR